MPNSPNFSACRLEYYGFGRRYIVLTRLAAGLPENSHSRTASVRRKSVGFERHAYRRPRGRSLDLKHLAYRLGTCAALAAGSAVQAAPGKAGADLILTNARVYT